MCVHFPCAQDGFFPLYVASQKGYIGIVDVLIKAGAKVDLQTKVGFAIALNVRSPSAPHYNAEHTDTLLGGCGGHRPIRTVCALYWFQYSEQSVTTLASIQATPTSSLCHLL